MKKLMRANRPYTFWSSFSNYLCSSFVLGTVLGNRDKQWMKHEFSGSLHTILGDAVNTQEPTVVCHVLISAVKNTKAGKGV